MPSTPSEQDEPHAHAAQRSSRSPQCPCPALHPRWTPVKRWVGKPRPLRNAMRPSPLAARKDHARPSRAARVGARPSLGQAR